MNSDIKEDLILLHGALGTAAQMQPLVRHFENRFNCRTMSFPGHGGRALPPSFSITEFAGDVIRFMDEQSISIAHFYGYSMGGYVALYLALHHSERVNSVCTYGTKFDWSPEFAAGEVKKLNPEKIEEKVPAFAESLKKSHHPENWKDVLRLTGRLLQKLGTEPLLNENELKQIKCPVMICIGTKDDTVGVDESRKAAGMIPAAELTILEGQPHPIKKAGLTALAGAFPV